MRIGGKTQDKMDEDEEGAWADDVEEGDGEGEDEGEGDGDGKGD